MAVQSAQISVGTSATSIALAGAGALQVRVKNAGGTSVFVGPAGVTTANGFELAAGGTLTLDLDTGNELFGVVATLTEPVHVLTT